jgi:hypothetical protein
MKENRMSQKDAIREYLESGKALTPIDALNMFGCFRLGARIHDLREEGLNIEMELVKGKYEARFAKYSLKTNEQ